MTTTHIDVLRRRLIKHFEAEQTISAEYLSFHGVAQKWAYLRKSGTISEEKEKALSDLMEAALDGVFPELLWMNPQASVELCLDRNTVEQIADELRRRGGEFDLWVEDENTAVMTPDKFALTRSGLGLGELNDRYLREKFKDCLWAPRAEVVAFLKGRGVAPSDLPAAWIVGLTTRDVQQGDKVAVTQFPNDPPKSRRGAPRKYSWENDARPFVIGELDANGDFDDPENRIDGWRSQEDLIDRLLKYMGSREEKEPGRSTAQGYVAKWVAEWRQNKANNAVA
jgi:hypothetical protein